MRKIVSLLIGCMLSGYGFTQSFPGNDPKSDSPKNTSQINKITSNVALPDMSIYPNPAKNKVTLQLKGFDAGMAVVRVMNTKGKVVREETRLLTNGNEDVIVFLMIDPGIYFIIVGEGQKTARKKLLIL